MTKTIEQELKKITDNWNLFISFIEKTVRDNAVKDSLLELCSEVEDRFAVCPASTRTEFTGAYPGGLIAHSLNVLRIMKDLNKTYKAKLSSDNLIITALFHDIGKIGTLEEDYYIPQESDWHRNKGMVYAINPNIPKVPVPIRSLWWLNSSSVPMAEHEIHAITSLQHIGQMYNQELYNAPLLTLCLQQAVRGACIISKEKNSIFDS